MERERGRVGGRAGSALALTDTLTYLACSGGFFTLETPIKFAFSCNIICKPADNYVENHNVDQVTEKIHTVLLLYSGRILATATETRLSQNYLYGCLRQFA
jgi:hypothetical protein